MPIRETLFQSLEDRGWAVADGLAPEGLPDRLARECRALWQAGGFRPAEVGRGERQSRQDTIRGDSIRWLDPDSAGAASREFLAWIASFRRDLNQAFYLGLNSQEFHFARYPAGAGYTRHLDQHRGGAARKVSVTLYLNPGWPADGGGELCLYPPTEEPGMAEFVLPVQGRMAVFLSDIIPHEVRPAAQTRWSLTGWLRTDTPGVPV